MSQVLDTRLEPLDAAEQRAAGEVGEVLQREARVVAPDGREFPVPNELARVFVELARAAANGETVRFQIGEPQALTARQAAESLGMSRTTLCKLMDAGEIAGSYVGTHRRIAVDEIDRYRRVRGLAMAERYAQRTAGIADVPDEPMPKRKGRATRRPQ